MKLNLYRGMKKVLFGSAVVLASSGIVGCSSNNSEEEVVSTPSLLEETVLEDTYVITDSNNDILIVRPTETYGDYIFETRYNKDNYANHYIDVLSNNCYHEKTTEDERCSIAKIGVLSIDVEQKKPISTYLTKEDLLKSEFTDEDVVEIIERIKSDSSSNTEEKAKQYTK